MRYLFEEYAFDIDRRELCRGVDLIPVTPQVFDLLHYLIRNRERVVGKNELIKAVNPGLRLSGLNDRLGPYQRTEDLARYHEGLHQAGLPE